MLGVRPNLTSNQHRNFVASFIDSLIAFVSAHAGLAYLTLFLAALLEAVPVVGSVIPGSTIILALSALVPGGELQLRRCWPPQSPARCSATDRRSGSAIARQREILSSWPLTNYPRLVAQSEAFFHRWGTLAVFFARFVPPIRAFVPVTAGALGMAPPRFYAVNIPAILLWAPAHVLPGVLAVSALHEYAGIPHHTGDRQASLDADRDRRRADRRARDLDDPPPPWRAGADDGADSKGFRLNPHVGLRPGAGPI